MAIKKTLFNFIKKETTAFENLYYWNLHYIFSNTAYFIWNEIFQNSLFEKCLIFWIYCFFENITIFFCSFICFHFYSNIANLICYFILFLSETLIFEISCKTFNTGINKAFVYRYTLFILKRVKVIKLGIFQKYTLIKN